MRPTKTHDTPDVDGVEQLGNVELVTGILDDTRDLIGAHVEQLRGEVSTRLTLLGATLTSAFIAVSVLVVTAILLSLSVAATLNALGATWWESLWIVTFVVGGIGVGFVLRARAQARNTVADNPITSLMKQDKP